MPAFVISMMSVHDPETYLKYTSRTPSIVKKYGGKFLTRGEEFTCVEGKDYDGRLVFLEFPSKKHVEDWFKDPDYEEAMKFRRCCKKVGKIQRIQSRSFDDLMATSISRGAASWSVALLVTKADAQRVLANNSKGLSPRSLIDLIR